jgi:hypothetical protein
MMKQSLLLFCTLPSCPQVRYMTGSLMDQLVGHLLKVMPQVCVWVKSCVLRGPDDEREGVPLGGSGMVCVQGRGDGRAKGVSEAT